MKSPLVPDAYYNSLFDIKFDKDHPFVIIDLDNTLLPISEIVASPAVIALFKKVREAGMVKDVTIVSNIGFATKHRLSRLKAVAEALGAHYVDATGWYVKPHRRPFEKALDLMHAKADQTVVIGDQMFTDIRGGNILGMYTILVKPLGKDKWPTKYYRWLERRLPYFKDQKAH